MIVAGTGHRPPRLGGYGAEAFSRLMKVAEAHLQRTGHCTVISGMAQGWDQALAATALRLGLPLIAAVPFEGQELKWPEHSQVRYRRLLAEADDVKVIHPGSIDEWPHEAFAFALQDRNEWMVDRADQVVALWDGAPRGGTANCVAYARGLGKPVTNLYSEWKAMVAK